MKTAIKPCLVSLVIFALSISAYAIDKESIVGYWSCDEGSGETVADVYGDADGTLMVGSGWEGEPHDDGWGEGKFGSGLAFDEDEEWFVDIGTNDTLDALGNPDTAFTIAYWIKSAKTSGKGRTVDKGSSGWTQGWHCAIVDGAVFSEMCDDIAPGVQVGGSEMIADDTWHHIAQVFEVGNEARIYVDGVLDSQGDISSEPDIAGVDWPITFGTVGFVENPWHEFLDGFMDEIVIFSKALSEAEINELMTEPVSSSITAVEARNRLVTTWVNIKSRY